MILDPIPTTPLAPMADGAGPHVVIIGGGASGVLMAAHLLRDPQIYDLFLFDAAWRREDPDFDEDDLRVYP